MSSKRFACREGNWSGLRDHFWRQSLCRSYRWRKTHLWSDLRWIRSIWKDYWPSIWRTEYSRRCSSRSRNRSRGRRRERLQCQWPISCRLISESRRLGPTRRTEWHIIHRFASHPLCNRSHWPLLSLRRMILRTHKVSSARFPLFANKRSFRWTWNRRRLRCKCS